MLKTLFYGLRKEAAIGRCSRKWLFGISKIKNMAVLKNENLGNYL